MNKILKSSLYVIVAAFIGITVSYAGSTLTAPHSPSKTMKSLSDLYQLINTGANTPSIDFTTPTTVSTTMNSIEESYDLLKSKIDDIDPATILTDTTIFGVEGSATAGTPAPTFASADQTTYTCESLAIDPAQPAVTLQTICGYHSADGCSWSGSACTGGTKTRAGGMTWYAATASCADKSDEGSTSWKLPTYEELVNHYLDNKNAGLPITGFQRGYYWSGTAYPYNSSAYGVDMYYGNANGNGKSSPSNLVHCAH